MKMRSIKRGWIIALCGVVFISAARWSSGQDVSGHALSPQDTFTAAGQAYERRQPLEAAQQYQQMLAAGYLAPELLYNLGNAFFKGGDLGRAVWAYRRAWQLAPRDPDIKANLRFALREAGAVEPDVALPNGLLRLLSKSEWALMATVAFWLCLPALGVAALSASRRGVFLRVATVAAVVWLVSMLGFWEWRSLEQRPEVAVIAAGQKAVAGPFADATTLFALPAGALARVEDMRGGWLEINYDRQRGWLPRPACLDIR